jgi:hypothetical protein
MGSAATGRWTAGFEEVESDLEYDFSNLTLEEHRTLISIQDKIGFKKKGE